MELGEGEGGHCAQLMARTARLLLGKRCTLMCLERWSLRANFFSHTGHWYGFTPEWDRRCLDNSSERENLWDMVVSQAIVGTATSDIKASATQVEVGGGGLGGRWQEGTGKARMDLKLLDHVYRHPRSSWQSPVSLRPPCGQESRAMRLSWPAPTSHVTGCPTREGT